MESFMKEGSNKKDSGLVGTLVFAGLALVGVGAYIWHNSRKELKKIKSADKRVTEEFKKSGIKREKIEEETGKSCEENSFVKAIYIGTAHNEKWATDAANTDEALQSNMLLHVIESNYRGRRNLDFIFEIPNYVNSSYANPKIGDYINGFKTISNEMWNIVKFSKAPHTSLVGYVVISYLNSEGEKKSEVRLLDKSVYASYAEEERGRDGLVAFYENYKKSDEKGREEAYKAISATLVELERKSVNLVVVDDIYLAWKVSFPIQTEGQFGINLISAVECLKYIFDGDAEIKRRGSDASKKYQNVIFHAQNEEGEFDMMYFYDTDEKGKIVTDTFEY